MRIESLEINNYRQYRKVKFDFSNSGSKHDIHIVHKPGDFRSPATVIPVHFFVRFPMMFSDRWQS